MDVGLLAGYRWVLAGHYDQHFGRLTPEDAARARQACGAYVARVLAALDLPDEGRHLDLGCGGGLAALAVARARPAMRVVGLDASSRALALARAAAQAEGLSKAGFVEGDAEDPPLAEGPFHRASALSLFNLMPDKAAALAAWRRALAPGGRLVLTDAFRTAGPGDKGTGAMSDPAFAALARRAGWQAVRREDLTPLVRRLHEAKAWPWPEYVRPGFRYLLHALEPR